MYIRNIQELPTITAREVNKIHEYETGFSYEFIKILRHIQCAMNVQLMARGVIEKLPGIKAEFDHKSGWMGRLWIC
jgi:hypothetical protein